MQELLCSMREVYVSRFDARQEGLCRPTGGSIRPNLTRRDCSENEWAPVHDGIAGPCIFVTGEGILENQFGLRIRRRVAFALQSRGMFELSEVR